ncbi:MAG: N-acetylmuramoyl-L-alanine amidase [Bacillota bacterium]|jgi:N-acetylmuramoyl-L-alanine amidase
MKIFKSKLILITFIVVLLCILADAVLYVYEEKKYDYDIMDVLSGAMIGKTLVIDAGHGGFDPGAIGLAGTKEKDVNLAVSRRLADYLRQSGATVIETRREDKALGDTKKADMAERVAVANNNDADVFISVQANFLPQHQYSGAQTFYHKDSAEGKALSENIQQAIIDNVGNTNRSAMSIDNIYVVRSLEIPSVIVEVGFLSNAEEEQLLNDEEYQSRMAYAVYIGIVEYYNGKAAGAEAPRNDINS